MAEQRGPRKHSAEKWRDSGRCTLCGNPALPTANKRAIAVNRRLAEGRGLTSEYHRATRGKWRPGDPPPTLARLTHEPFCERCTQLRKAAQEKKGKKRVARQDADRKRRAKYAETRAAGLCGRCGEEPEGTTTVEGDNCTRSRIERALRSPKADEIAERVRAGELQKNIRAITGVSVSIISAITMSVRKEQGGSPRPGRGRGEPKVERSGRSGRRGPR